MKYPNPKQLFLLNKEAVQWWQSVVDDPRYQTIRLLAELHAIRGLQSSFAANEMMSRDAIRQGVVYGIDTLTRFADVTTNAKAAELPPTLHDPDLPVPPRNNK